MLLLSEDIIQVLVTRLQADLNTTIDAVNVGITDSATLEHVDNSRILDYVPALKELVSFPTVCIAEGPITFEDDTAWAATGIVLLDVVCFIEAIDQQTLARRLRRMARAVATVVLDHRHLRPEGWGVTLRRIDPGPTLGRREDPRKKMSWFSVSITVKRDED